MTATSPTLFVTIKTNLARFFGAGILLMDLLVASAAWARSLEAVIASGQLRVAVKDNLPPLGFRNDSDELVGFEIDLAKELAHRILGSSDNLDLRVVTNVERLEVVVSEQVDLAIAQIGITADRARQVDFSPPYYSDGTALVVARANGWSRWLDLQGKSVGVLQGSAAIPYLSTLLTHVERIEVDSYTIGLEQLQAGQIAAFAGDRTVLSGWLAEHPDYEWLGSPLAAVGLGVAFPKGLESGSLSRRVTQEIEALRESGWLAAQAKRWGLP
ncbi:MAG: transporter substrate-binding domain-containing protein [Cyanobacteriota bacterium]|nr:transporter substrate-binding domain-containing protein [Cyanobacteriota bacterium]